MTLFLPGTPQAQHAADGNGLRLELEQAYAKAQSAARSGDFDAFMLVYEPAKGRTLVREQWPVAREVILLELARPAGAGFLRATRKGWWAGYYFRDDDSGSAGFTMPRVTMHRYHMSETGWRLRGESVTRPVARADTQALTTANAQREIDSNPDFRLPQ